MSFQPQSTSAAAKQPKSLFHQLATVSWAAPIAVAAVNIFLQNSPNHGELAESVVVAVLGLFLYVAGLGCGIAALFGIPRLGRKGILLPALIGIVLNGGLLALLGYLLLAHAQPGP